LAAISRERPGLKLDTWIGRTPELVEAVRNEKYDLAIVDASAINNPGGLVVEHLASLIGGFIVRREHPLSAKSTCDLSEIREYPVACSPISDELARRMVDTFGPAGHPTQLFTYFCDSYHILRELALNSDAVVMSIWAAMRTELDSGELVRLNVNNPPLFGHYAVIRRASRWVSPAESELWQEARSLFAELAVYSSPRPDLGSRSVAE
jgi:DNA-binding transcriptional LysR family regulator